MGASECIAEMNLTTRIAKLATPEILSFMKPRESATLSEVFRAIRNKIDEKMGDYIFGSRSILYNRSYERGVKLALEILKDQGQIKEGVFERTFILSR